MELKIEEFISKQSLNFNQNITRHDFTIWLDVQLHLRYNYKR